MPSIAEVFKLEMLARLQADPLSAYSASVDAPLLVENIRRSHLTAVNRDRAPAIYVRFGKAKVTEDKNCNWLWQHEWTVSVYVRSDDDAEGDPIVIEAVTRLNPLTSTGYANQVVVKLTQIDAETEIADSDAQRVDIIGVAGYTTAPWTLDQSK